MTTAAAFPLPLTIGDPQQFRALRTGLQQSDFTEEGICRRLGVQSIFEFQSLREGRRTGAGIDDSLDVLIRLLLDCEAIGKEQMALLPADLVAVLEGLGVAVRAPGEPVRWWAAVALYPVAGFYVASDRTFLPEPGGPPVEFVYAAATGNTGRFLSILPEQPCDAFLDLCAGTGIAAIVAGARYAGRAWAADLGQRSVHFSDFNRRLNGLENVVPVRGDLYDAVGDLTFDRIAAHPPYVPNKDNKLLFRDGGADGEQILARIVAGLPRHLRPGGRFYCLTLATDREGEPFEQRVRRWLGPDEGEFDIVLVGFEVRYHLDKVIQAVIKAKGGLGEVSETTEHYGELKVTGTFYGAVVVERKTAARPAVTSRALKAARAGGEAVDWCVRWETAAAGPDFPDLLLDTRPRLAENAALHVIHKRREGELVPTNFELRASYPLVGEAVVEPWVAVLAGACDGKRSGREVFAGLQQQEVIAPAMTEEEFAGVLKLLVSNGFLENEQFPLPAVRQDPSAAASPTA